MNWLNNLLTQNNLNELKPTFGQAFLYASGYDDVHEEIHHRNDPNIRETNNRTDLKINIEMASSFADYHKLSEVFGVQRLEFLKFIANRSNRMEEILQFLNKNINGYTMICNIYMVKKEATVDYHSKSKIVSRHISKIILGHHIILCVPLAAPFYDLFTAKKMISSLILRNSESPCPNYFLPDSAALIDYTDTVEKPAFEILNELNDYPFSNNISLIVELPKLEKITTYNNFSAERTALLTILKLKKLNYLIEEKFWLKSIYTCGKKSMPMGDRDTIAEQIIEKIKNLETLNVSSPPTVVDLYNHSKVYEKEYLFALYENNYVPALYQKLEENIDIAYRTIKNMPLKRGENTDVPKPEPQKRIRRDWPCIKRLKEIADKLGKEWQNDKISRNFMEDILNVQMAANIKHDDFKKKTLKDSLDILLKEVSGELYDTIKEFIDESTDNKGEIIDTINTSLITEFVDGNESIKTDLSKSIDIFADKFADEMRNKNLSRTLCEEFTEFQMAKNCKLEDLQIEPLLDALTSTEITLLPGNIFKRDIQNLRTLLEEEQQRRMPKIKNVEIKVGTKTVFSNQIQENTNLQKYFHLNNKNDESFLEIIINSTTNIADIFLPESKTVILHLTVNWDETYNFDILPLFNVITISTYKVVTYIPLTDDFTSFLSSIDYGGTTPKIGVENESPTVVKDLITVLGLTEIPKNASKTMAVYALRGFPELIYFIQTNQRTHFVNPETAVSELLKETSKNIDKSNIIFTIPRSFNDIQKVAYSKAAEYANLTNIKFVDEIISLAYGYELIHEIDDNKVYLLVYYFYPNFILSIFKSGIIKEKEISTIQVEFEDFKEWEQTFFDSIINEALQNDDKFKNSSNKIDQLFEKTTDKHQQFDSIVVALKNGTLLSKMFADNFPSIAVTTINDQETYIARGANIALHSSMVSY